MTTPTTIAVAYASIGSGHRIAAEALIAEIERRALDGVTVHPFDIQECSSGGISGDRLATTFTGPTAGIYDRLWKSDAFCSTMRVIGGPFVGLSFRAFEQKLEELAPDIVICTHALASVLALRARKSSSHRFAVVNVATDFAVHGYWPREDVDLFCVADEPSRDSLIERHMPAERVAVTGIPIRRQFTLEYDRAAAREHFDLPAERRIVLALAGSMMPGPYRHFKEALATSLPALASLPDTSVVVVTGKDDAFAEDLRARSAGFGTISVRVLGFVEHMAPLMACADLGLAKPGGSICAECLAAGLPLVLVGPAVGQESANAQALTKAGAALFAADPSSLTVHTRKVMSSPARLAKLRTSAVATARPFAAADICDRALALTGIAEGDAGATTLTESTPLVKLPAAPEDGEPNRGDGTVADSSRDAAGDIDAAPDPGDGAASS